MNYYNDTDAYCVKWLWNLIANGLIPKGDVDDRPIQFIQPEDLKGYTQHHFFAGSGGWPLALTLAGWAETKEVWTGSCPCQPFSTAGQKQGFEDPRHLWPEFHRLIGQCRPSTLFGEQVASATDWLGAVYRDLEELDYAVGAMPIEAASVGANHRRDRIYLVAHAKHIRRHETKVTKRTGSRVDTSGWPKGAKQPTRPSRRSGGLADLATAPSGGYAGDWWKTEPAVGRLVDGIPPKLAAMRALGNAIVPQVAAEFIRATM